MNLILAQGAEHTNPLRLQKIVTIIDIQKKNFTDLVDRTEAQRIRDIYEPNFPLDWPIYSNVSYVAEEKFDGFSYINSDGRFFSKRLSNAKGNEGQPIEKTGHVLHLSAILSRVNTLCSPDLQGELYMPGGISDNVSTIMGCSEDEAISRQLILKTHPLLHYMLIDLRGYKGKILINEPYYVRRAIMEFMYHKYVVPVNSGGLIHLSGILPPHPVSEFRRIVRSGGEGIIIKRTDARFIPGKKPADNWIKGKKKITLDAVVMGYNDGTGKNQSLFGSIEFGLYIDGVLKKMGSTSSGMNDATRQMIAADPDRYVNKWVVELEAIQESRNSFRNAVFLRIRDDKDPKECTPINIRVKEGLLDV